MSKTDENYWKEYNPDNDDWITPIVLLITILVVSWIGWNVLLTIWTWGIK